MIFMTSRLVTVVLCVRFVPEFLPVKIKCTLVQALGLCTGRTAHIGSTGIVPPFYDLGTRRG